MDDGRLCRRFPGMDLLRHLEIDRNAGGIILRRRRKMMPTTHWRLNSFREGQLKQVAAAHRQLTPLANSQAFQISRLALQLVETRTTYYHQQQNENALIPINVQQQQTTRLINSPRWTNQPQRRSNHAKNTTLASANLLHFNRRTPNVNL